MAGSYSQIYIQIVFAVKCRQNLVGKSWKVELYKYISGLITNKGHKPIIINGVADHIHIFIGLKPFMSISELVRDIKCNSSKFINEKGFIDTKFSWQNGFGAFSYSNSHIDRVYKYIERQEEHHRKKTFKEEYIKLLNQFNIEYDERYLFDWLE